MALASVSRDLAPGSPPLRRAQPPHCVQGSRYSRRNYGQGNGKGRFTDQHIVNALRYGVRPEDTPEVKITAKMPGRGDFPQEPKYLGPFMSCRGHPGACRMKISGRSSRICVMG